MQQRSWIGIGALMAATGVAAGAFGAHSLQGRIEPDLLAVWRTAADYHLLHAVGIVAVAFAVDRGVHFAPLAGWLLVAGTAVFSGSLYVLAATGIRALGAVTPIGGVALILGWTLLTIGGFSKVQGRDR